VPDQLTQTAVTIYLEQLQAAGYSRSHCARVKAVISGFARYLIEEHGALRRNPARGLTLPPAAALAPRQLSGDQRFVLRSLVEREGTTRGAAIFALGYWAGCRVSDLAHLETVHLHVTPKLGWMTVGHKGGKQRTVDLHNEARRALYSYIHATALASERRYVFPSQRSERLTEAGHRRRVGADRASDLSRLAARFRASGACRWLESGRGRLLPGPSLQLGAYRRCLPA